MRRGEDKIPPPYGQLGERDKMKDRACQNGGRQQPLQPSRFAGERKQHVHHTHAIEDQRDS